MKQRISTLISLVVLLLSFLLARYGLFSVHQMKQWPEVLAWLGFFMILFSGLVKQCQYLPLFTTTGYLLGFLAGYALETVTIHPERGAMSDMWLIWGVVYLASMIIGLILDIFTKLCHRRK